MCSHQQQVLLGKVLHASLLHRLALQLWQGSLGSAM
jgi:hypothetical protein